VAVEVRTRGAKGWSQWQQLGVEGVGAAPRGALAPSDDGAGTRAGTEPIYTRPSSGVQVRVDLISGDLPADLRVDLVDPGASDADASVTAQPISATGAAVTQPAILTRAQWGADESLRNGFAGYGETIKAGFVHHTTGASDYTSAEVPALIRSIYAYHTQTLGWSDIGYNFLVDRFGRLFEGRRGGMDRPVIGAHTGGFNTNTAGVAALGDHETSPVPAAVMTGFGQLLGWKLGLHGADPYGRVTLTSGGGDSNRFPAGQTVEFNVISGHHDASYTPCPGQYLFPRLSEIRSEAAASIGQPGPLRAVTPSRVLDTRTGLGAPPARSRLARHAASRSPAEAASPPAGSGRWSSTSPRSSPAGAATSPSTLRAARAQRPPTSTTLRDGRRSPTWSMSRSAAAERWQSTPAVPTSTS
jgi:uncharacterized protein with LGFP repeats